MLHCFGRADDDGFLHVSITASASALGIKPGAGLYSITGLSLYFFGTAQKLRCFVSKEATPSRPMLPRHSMTMALATIQ